MRLWQISVQVDAGIFTALDKATVEDQKVSLQARVQAVRAALEKTRVALAAVRQSNACRVMSQYPDWDTYFQTQAKKLDKEIERLTGIIQAPPS